MQYLEQWFSEEMKWMKQYRKKVMKGMLTKTLPIIAIIFFAIWGILAVASGGLENLWIGLVVALGSLLFVLLIMALCLFPAYGSKRIVRFIKRSMKKLKMDDREQERVAKEMLEAAKDPSRVIHYDMSGPMSRSPIGFTMTPHYAFLKGSNPVAILVRMSDVAEVVTERQRKMTVLYPGQNNGFKVYPMFVIGFYYKNRTKKNISQPDAYFCFFDEGFRNKILEMITYKQEQE